MNLEDMKELYNTIIFGILLFIMIIIISFVGSL